MNNNVTHKEQDIIDRCCAWLSEEEYAMAVEYATESADQITQPEIAGQLLIKILTTVIVRNRPANK